MASGPPRRALSVFGPFGYRIAHHHILATGREAGETNSAIAESLNVSVATARRMLSNLELADAIENGDRADKHTLGEKKLIVSTVS